MLIAEGDYTCSVADFTGTFKGLMKGVDGKMVQPTNSKFHLKSCTVAHWMDSRRWPNWNVKADRRDVATIQQ